MLEDAVLHGGEHAKTMRKMSKIVEKQKHALMNRPMRFDEN